MSHSYYPVALDLNGKPCLVVGGGVIADGKLDALLDAGARITVVSPDVLPRIEALATGGLITLHRRRYRSADIGGTYLVIAATHDRAANAAVAADGRAAGVLVNAVDDIPNCDFFAVSVVRRGDLQLAISTAGRSPAFARWMREYLDASLPAEFGDLLAILGDVRGTLKARGPIPAYEHWQAAITDDVLDALRSGDREGAATRVFDRVVAGVITDEAPVAALVD
ncbi:MAG TPA: bifunctional precorrin-2 dehydrogenase/sirohydrochlorin ferrochelatase [Thermomicrobiales bacterium]|jgi:precorrin-2 dehydrogenase/sirohydrochlorin ferrochelatase